MDSEHVQNFCAVTGAEPSIATGYLQVAENNVEQAISLYFENGGQPLHSDNSSTGGPGASFVPTEAAGYGDDEVRAPIAARRDVLVDDYSGGMGGMYEPAYGGGSGGGYNRRGATRSSAAAASIFNQGAGGPSYVPLRDFAQEAAEIAAGESLGASMTLEQAASSRRSRLAELFKPPFDIMHSGNIDSARHEAMEDGKWVMINLQEVSDFRCQALNRDIWRQQIIKDVVTQDFVFFQISIETAEGARLATMYNALEFPFVAAIHPKTGELRRLFVRFENATDMLEDIANFVIDHPMSKKNNGGNVATGSESSSRVRASAAARTRYMTEEEELAAAIAASELEGRDARSQGSGNIANPISVESDSDMDSDYENSDSYSEIHTISSESDADGIDDDVYDDDSGEMEVEERLSAHEQQTAELAGPGAWYKTLPVVQPSEPALGPTVTRIQFRFPNGQRVVRRFEKAAKVATIFQYLKATPPTSSSSEVPEAMFMGARLADSIEQTIEEAKLVNASITIDV